MKKRSAILGAAFLMATSAIGPGFLTQTSLFTEQLLASFGFVILISVLLDIGAQLNIWQILAINNTRAQDMANKVFPGMGYMLAGLIAFGGLVFNIGNIAGCGLGLQVLTGIDVKVGAAISCIVALCIFWYKDTGRLVDWFTKLLGLLMIALTIYIVFASNPPLGEALYRTVWPEKIDISKIITLVGGTVGGYISFAGAHRLIDAGITGAENKKHITRSAVSGIIITSVMRFILFLAVLGVVSTGLKLSATNPAASVFQHAAGNIGYYFFGVVIWSAAITSVIGASFTTVSFWRTLVPAINKNNKVVISIFIIAATLIFITLGNPVKLLVFAGMINGMILPIALAIILLALHKSAALTGYKHAVWLQVFGWMVVACMFYMSVITIVTSVQKL